MAHPSIPSFSRKGRRDGAARDSFATLARSVQQRTPSPRGRGRGVRGPSVKLFASQGKPRAAMLNAIKNIYRLDQGRSRRSPGTASGFVPASDLAARDLCALCATWTMAGGAAAKRKERAAFARHPGARPDLYQAWPVPGDAPRRRRPAAGQRLWAPCATGLPPFPRRSRPKRNIEAAFGKPWTERLSASFGPAVAAASIAQVHKARVQSNGRRARGRGQNPAARHRAALRARS